MEISTQMAMESKLLHWAQLCSTMATDAVAVIRLLAMPLRFLNGALTVHHPLRSLLQTSVHRIIIFLTTMVGGATPQDHTSTCLNLPSSLLPSTKLELYLFSTESMFSILVHYLNIYGKLFRIRSLLEYYF